MPPEILGRGGIEYAANKSGLRAHAKQLVFEITERGVPDQLGLDALNSIPTTGARVALDDTTLSGANLALLTRCHFDFVKIDRTLVAQLNDTTKRPQWLDGLAALLGSTPLQVIAEGIERGVGSHGARESRRTTGSGPFVLATAAGERVQTLLRHPPHPPTPLPPTHPPPPPPLTHSLPPTDPSPPPHEPPPQIPPETRSSPPDPNHMTPSRPPTPLATELSASLTAPDYSRPCPVRSIHSESL